MKDPDASDYVVGVVGCGAMGQGIAQVSVQGGIRALLFDAREGGADAAKAAISKRLARLAEKGRMPEDAVAAAVDLLQPVSSVSDLAECDCVVEAVFEDLDVKQAIFTELEGVVSPDCILASNTSSIPISSIARACTHRNRVAGLHFFNPVPLMKLVEVIRAAQTSDQTISALMTLGQRMTRVPVEVKDAPGFLVNMGGRAYTTEALRIVHEGVATPVQVDAIMRDCWGFRMGPFELMDLTGIDVNYPVSQIIYEGYNQDPRLKTSANHKAMFDAGLFGRKTGQGWYRYEDGKMIDPPSPDFETDAAPVRRIALAMPANEDLRADQELSEHFRLHDALTELCREMGVEIVEDDGACPVLAAPVDADASWLAEEYVEPHGRLVCVDLVGDSSRRITLMTPPGGDAGCLNAVAAAIAASGRKVTAVKDSVGFVGPRMVAMVANLGCYMAEIGLASPEDIDTAMQLGLNYPRGSIALGEGMRPNVLVDICHSLQARTGDDRYRPAQWLERRAGLGLSLYTPN